jgi:hypothetical protein
LLAAALGFAAVERVAAGFFAAAVVALLAPAGLRAAGLRVVAALGFDAAARPFAAVELEVDFG